MLFHAGVCECVPGVPVLMLMMWLTRTLAIAKVVALVKEEHGGWVGTLDELDDYPAQP